jgi:hypothetical protein
MRIKHAYLLAYSAGKRENTQITCHHRKDY